MPRLTAVLPEVIVTEPGLNPVVIPQKKVTKSDWQTHFSKVDLDVEYAGIGVDALAYQKGHKCGISINVGYEFDNSLIYICEKASISMIEIKLDPFIALGIPLADFEQYVLFNAPRRWLYNHKFNRWCGDEELTRQQEAKKLMKSHSKTYVSNGYKLPIKRSKRFGLISEVMISQSTMLTLASVNQCRECKLISLTSNQCTHCSSKSLEKVKSSRLSKATLEQSVRNRYTEVMA